MLFHTIMIIYSSILLGPTVIHFFLKYQTEDTECSEGERNTWIRQGSFYGI